MLPSELRPCVHKQPVTTSMKLARAGFVVAAIVTVGYAVTSCSGFALLDTETPTETRGAGTMSQVDHEAEVRAIVHEMRTWPAWKRWGSRACTAIAAGLASVPTLPLGGLSILVDKFGTNFLEPDLEKKVAKLALALQATMAERKANEDDVVEVLRFLEQNQIFEKMVSDIVKSAAPDELKAWRANADNAVQEFIRVTVRQMNVRFEAHNKGRQHLENFRSSGGNVDFNSSSGAHQSVKDSTFEGGGNSIRFDGVRLHGGISAQPVGPGLAPDGPLGPGQRVTFKPGSKLVFDKDGGVVDFGNGFGFGVGPGPGQQLAPRKEPPNDGRK